MTVGVPRPLRDSSTLPVDEWRSFSSSARDEFGPVLRTRIRRFPAGSPRLHREIPPAGAAGRRLELGTRAELTEAADRARLYGAHGAGRVRRPRRRVRHPQGRHHCGGIRGGTSAWRSRGAGHLDARAYAAGARHRGAETHVHPTDAVRRDDLVPGLLRAERWLGSREPAHVGGPGRRRVGGQRVQDLDFDGASGRLDVLPGAHRTGSAETPGHQLSVDQDGRAGHRDTAACGHDHGAQLQRGFFD